MDACSLDRFGKRGVSEVSTGGVLSPIRPWIDSKGPQPASSVWKRAPPSNVTGWDIELNSFEIERGIEKRVDGIVLETLRCF